VNAESGRSGELLEILLRLHPDGPEAVPEGDLQPDLVRAVEALVQFEADIHEMVDVAQRATESIQQQAVVAVRQIEDEIAARVEHAGVRSVHRKRGRPEADQRTIMQRASQDVERAHRDATAGISETVAAATAIVLAAVTPASRVRVA